MKVSNKAAITTLIVTISIEENPINDSFLTKMAIIPHKEALMAINNIGRALLNFTYLPFYYTSLIFLFSRKIPPYISIILSYFSKNRIWDEYKKNNRNGFCCKIIIEKEDA